MILSHTHTPPPPREGRNGGRRRRVRPRLRRGSEKTARGAVGASGWLRERAPGSADLDLPGREDASPLGGAGRGPGLCAAAFSTLNFYLDDKGAKLNLIQCSGHFHW